MKISPSAFRAYTQLSVALLQGLVMERLMRPNDWLDAHPAFTVAMLSLVLLGPASLFLLQNGRDRIGKWLGVLLFLAILLGVWRGLLINPGKDYQHLGYFDSRLDFFYFALMVLWQILLPFAQTASSGRSFSDYPRLFHFGWHNVLTLLEATVFTAMFWALLLIGSALFVTIDISLPQRVVSHPLFSYPALTACFACAVILSQRHSGFTQAVQLHVLEIFKWLLPPVMLITFGFTLSLPLTGLQALLKSGSSTTLLLWLSALQILFINAAYGDGQSAPSYPRWLALILRLAPLALPVLCAIALYGLWLRIGQYGLSVERVWAVFVALIASAYALGYLWTIPRRTAWLAGTGKVNLVVALLMAGGMVLLLSPLLNPAQLTVRNQIARLADGRVPAQEFDFAYLRSLGTPGTDALRQLAQAKNLPQSPEVNRLALLALN